MTQTPYFEEYLKIKKIKNSIQAGSMWKIAKTNFVSFNKIIEVLEVYNRQVVARYVDDPEIYSWEWSLEYIMHLIHVGIISPLLPEDSQSDVPPVELAQ